MNELTLVLEVLLKAVYEAIEKDNSMALETLINDNKTFLSKAASEKYLLVEAFNHHAMECFKVMHNKLDIESKEKQLGVIEEFILSRTREHKHLNTETDLSMIRLIGDLDFEDRLYYELKAHIDNDFHILMFAAFLRQSSLSPLEYLKIASSD
ncbi:hypothetical protein [Alteromonas sp. BMJM2]|uniref:hypothetical protein n=1 Tax=Alteromonas sp. BMJM2 TaxID=2954241 RepID=UPI0022B47BE9|nr:hypothetical protein [Alteromonas sp. BMJM2]